MFGLLVLWKNYNLMQVSPLQLIAITLSMFMQLYLNYFYNLFFHPCIKIEYFVHTYMAWPVKARSMTGKSSGKS